MISLRERRRRETEAMIQKAALRLATERCVEAVTIEAICSEVGISPRTFFNYFPFREAAFTISPPSIPDEAAEAFVRGEGCLLADLTELLVAQISGREPDRRTFRALGDIWANHPRIVAMQMARSHAYDVEVAGLMARRLGRAEGDVGCLMLAAAVAAAVRVVIDAWAQEDDGQPLATALRQGLAHLSQLCGNAAHPS